MKYKYGVGIKFGLKIFLIMFTIKDKKLICNPNIKKNFHTVSYKNT